MRFSTFAFLLVAPLALTSASIDSLISDGKSFTSTNTEVSSLKSGAHSTASSIRSSRSSRDSASSAAQATGGKVASQTTLSTDSGATTSTAGVVNGTPAGQAVSGASSTGSFSVSSTGAAAPRITACMGAGMIMGAGAAAMLY